jgi:hypothetical protein
VIARGWAGPSPVRDDPDREVRVASAVQSPGRALHARGPAQPVDPGRSGRGCCAVLTPLLPRVEAHVFEAERLRGDDPTVPVLAKGKTDAGRYGPMSPRPSAIWRAGASGGDVSLLARPWILGLWSRLMKLARQIKSNGSVRSACC